MEKQIKQFGEAKSHLPPQHNVSNPDISDQLSPSANSQAMFQPDQPNPQTPLDVNSSPILGLQRAVGNQAVGRLLTKKASPSTTARQQIARAEAHVIQRSWVGDRIDWVRVATRADNWASAEPPGAYYVLNGLSMEDMVRVLRGLTKSDLAKLTTHLDTDAGGFDRARLQQGLMQASAAPDEHFFQDISAKIHTAIRAGQMVDYPDGAYWVINPLNAQDTTKIMRFLSRDHLDELIANYQNATSAGVPNAMRIVSEATTARKAHGANAKETSIGSLIPGAHKVGQYELPTTTADCREAFKALAALNDADLRRAIRALSDDQRFTLQINIDQVDGLGIDGNRMRHFLQLADSTADALRADAAIDSVWQPDYQKPPGDYSHTLRVNPPWNLNTFFDLVIDEIGDTEPAPDEVSRQWQQATIGRGGLLWPAQLNKGTVPNLWQMKQQVRQQIANWHGQDMLFIIQSFMAVEFVLHMGVGITMSQMTTRPRIGGVARNRTTPPGGGQSGGEDPQEIPLLPQKGTRQKPTFDLNLTPNDDSGMGHLDYRHAPWSKVKDTSKFNQDSWIKLRELVNETAEKGTIGTLKPSPQGEPQAGVVYEHRFATPVGVNPKGKPLYRIRVVVDANNHVTTTFPF